MGTGGLASTAGAARVAGKASQDWVLVLVLGWSRVLPGCGGGPCAGRGPLLHRGTEWFLAAGDWVLGRWSWGACGLDGKGLAARAPGLA